MYALFITLLKIFFFLNMIYKSVSYFEIKTEVESELFDVPEICETPPTFVSKVKSSSLESEDAFQGELGDAEIPEASAIALNFANV